LEAQFSSKTVESGNLDGPAFSSQKATVKLNKFWIWKFWKIIDWKLKFWKIIGMMVCF